MTSSNPVSDQSIDPTDNQSEGQSVDPTGIPAYSSASNQIITEYGKQNMFATQVQTQLVENYSRPLGNDRNDCFTRRLYHYWTNYSWHILNSFNKSIFI